MNTSVPRAQLPVDNTGFPNTLDQKMLSESIEPILKRIAVPPPQYVHG